VLTTRGLHRCRPSHLEHAVMASVCDEWVRGGELTPLVVRDSERGTLE
jgi:hypothetical protein